jgi:hypothetical protein
MHPPEALLDDQVVPREDVGEAYQWFQPNGLQFLLPPVPRIRHNL